jgi:hypothetical protein
MKKYFHVTYSFRTMSLVLGSVDGTRQEPVSFENTREWRNCDMSTAQKSFFSILFSNLFLRLL